MRESRMPTRTLSTTSSSARAVPAACSPTGSPPRGGIACCCSRPGAGIATSGSTSRSATASCSPTPGSTGSMPRSRRPELDNRRIIQPRGKVLGGSSSINGLLYIRGQAGGFRSLAPARQCRLELRGRAALFPPRRGPGARRRCAARGRRAARGLQRQRAASAVRGFHRGRAAGGLCAQRRFQRADPGRRRLFPAHCAQRAALVDRGRLSAAGAPAGKSRGGAECADDPRSVRGQARGRRRIPAGRRARAPPTPTAR